MCCGRFPETASCTSPGASPSASSRWPTGGPSSTCAHRSPRCGGRSPPRGRSRAPSWSACSRGEGAYPRSGALCGRLLRVLGELGLAEVDGRALRATPGARTDLDRSAAHRAYSSRLAEAERYLGGSARKAGRAGVLTASRPRLHFAPCRRRLGRRPTRSQQLPSRRGGGARTARARPASPSPTSSTCRSATSRRAAPASALQSLTDDQRVLLGDLFAVVEEHASDAAEKIDRKLVQDGVRVRVRPPFRPAPGLGRGLHRAPRRRGEDLRGHAARHRHAVRRAAARHGGGHQRVDRGGARATSATRWPCWWTA